MEVLVEGSLGRKKPDILFPILIFAREDEGRSH